MNHKLKHLDIFSGFAGFALGLKWTGGFKTVAFCEIDTYCQKVIAKNFPGVPIYDDVRTLDYEGSVDIITGGYPCQPFSLAGKREGQEDDRHLWPAMFSLIKKHRPTWVIGENVAGHISLGLDSVLADLESEKYAVQTFIIPACAVDAKHRRNRLWIIAYSQSNGRHKRKQDARRRRKGDAEGQKPGLRYDRSTMANPPGKQNRGIQQQGLQPHIRTGGQAVTDPVEQRPQGRGHLEEQIKEWDATEKIRYDTPGLCSGINRQWPTEPGVGRVAHGVPKRVDRLKGLGNAVVPQIPEIIGYAILEAEGIEI